MFLYSAVSSPLDRSKRFTLFALPDRPIRSDTNSASLGSILATLQLLCGDYSLTFPPPSIDMHSFTQLSELRCRAMNENGQSTKRQNNRFEPRLSRLRVRHSTLIYHAKFQCFEGVRSNVISVTSVCGECQLSRQKALRNTRMTT